MSTLRHAVLVSGFKNTPELFYTLSEAEVYFKQQSQAMLGVSDGESFLPNKFRLNGEDLLSAEQFFDSSRVSYEDFPHTLVYKNKADEIIFSRTFDSRGLAHDATESICDFLTQSGVKVEIKSCDIILDIFDIVVA